MPVSKITSTQFEQQLADDIGVRDSTVDTVVGPVRDFVIRAPSRVFEAQNERIRALFQLLALQNVNTLDPTDIDAFVFNEQVLRSTGTPSFITLTFSRVATPQFDLTIPANFPVGTDSDPDTGVQTTFVTLEAVTLFAATAGAYFNGVTNRYELNVTAASVTSGQSTSVGRNRVTKPLRPLLGFDSVTNKELSQGGLAAEINQQVADRYFLRIQGTEIGTPAGLSRYVRQTFGNVQDLLVVQGNDPFLTRAAVDAGAVDVWILGASPIQRTITVSFPGRLVLIPFDRQPGISVQSVQAGPIFVQNVDYTYVSDTGINSRSVRGQDGIVFLATGSAPAIGTPTTITFTYDNLIVALQSFFGGVEYKESGRDELFRRGIQVDIAIQAQLRVNAGNPTVVLAQVTQAILDFINGSTVQRGYGLGQDVEEFDIDGVLSRIPGVDNFIFLLLAPVGSTGVADIPIASNQYARISLANLAITLI